VIAASAAESILVRTHMRQWLQSRAGPLDAVSDPVELAERVFGHDHWSKIGDIMRAVFVPHSRTAVKGCHSSGKTFGAADIIPVALLRGYDVVTTAPTDDQVRGQLWRQVNANIRDSRLPRSVWGEVNQTEIRPPTGERAWGRATNQGVRFQGEHARAGRALIVIVDEGPGVIGDVMGAIEGMRAGGDVRVLLMGNPLVASGHFYEAFYPPDGRATPWSTFSISAFDTPNLCGLTIDDVLAMSADELDQNERPYLITRRYVREKYQEWGPDHWEYQARVLAAFPLQSDDSLFSLSWLEAAAARSGAFDPALPVQAGVDVAGPGEDETVLTVAQAGTILAQQAWPQADPRGSVLAALRAYQAKLDLVNVDSVGLGWGMYLHLRDHLGDCVKPVNVGESPTNKVRTDTVKFRNLKAELYWNARDWLRDGMVSGLDRRSVSQLASIRYSHDHAGRVEIEAKDKARARGVRSPDWAESTVLALWRSPVEAHRTLWGTSHRLVRHGRR
jgi:hypothetical protein